MKRAAAVAVGLGLVVILLAEPRTAVITGLAMVAGGLFWVGRRVRQLNRAVQRYAARSERGGEPELGVQSGRARREAAEQAERKVLRRRRLWLWHGYTRTGIEGMHEFCSDPNRSKEARFEGLMSVADRRELAGEQGLARSARRSALLTDPSRANAARVRAVVAPGSDRIHFDVLHVSDFGLPGGTTSSQLQEIRAQSRAGLRTGLLTTPVSRCHAGRPLNPKVVDVVDGDRVRFVHWSDRVTCDLMVVRHPRVCEHLLEDLPGVEADRTVLVVNQPPFVYYGAEGPSQHAWDPSRVHDALTDWVGEHSWHPIGPVVRDALVEYHGAELEGVDLAPDDWVNIIDLPSWQRPQRREPDGTTRIGRHTRDAACKWPESPESLAAAYPSGPGREVHVLGGAGSADKLLGRRTEGWKVHAFDTLAPREFLHGLDVYSYFTASDYVEAFGRAPLEAMAAGVPTIMPARFKPLFGEAGVYTDPFGVSEEASLLMTDHERYEQQTGRAWAFLSERFSHEAHLRRLADLGVGVR